MACVDGVSLGNTARSTTHTDNPARAKRMANEDPAHRAPTITTSKSSGIPGPHKSVEHRYNLGQRALRTEVRVAQRVGRRPTQEKIRVDLLDATASLLERDGPEAVQARSVAEAADTSTQSLYTLFGSTSGLVEAVVRRGFQEFGVHVGAVEETEDPVADHFSKGWAYCDWAFGHPQLYRLMFGLTGGALKPHSGLELTIGGSVANFPEGRAALDVLLQSVQQVIDAGRVRPVEAMTVAGQFLSATHGAVLLQIAGAFGDSE